MRCFQFWVARGLRNGRGAKEQSSLFLDRFQILIFHSPYLWMKVRVQSQCSKLDTGKTGFSFSCHKSLGIAHKPKEPWVYKRLEAI